MPKIVTLIVLLACPGVESAEGPPSPSTASGAARAILTDARADLDARRAALAELLRAHDPDLAPILHALLAEPGLRGPALRALAAYDDPKTPEVILAALPKLTLGERNVALKTMASRPPYARALLAAVAAGRLPRKLLTADIIGPMRGLGEDELNEQVGAVWGQARAPSPDKAQRIARCKEMLASKPMRRPDSALGRSVFVKTCQQCHTLFGVGGQVGPDLTGTGRADRDYLLTNVIDPGAFIAADYQTHLVATTRGRVLTGIIRSEAGDSLTLITADDIVVLPKDQVEERRPSDTSYMPDDLLAGLSEHEARSLVAYLAEPAQVAVLATPENAPGFFNGRDLTGWEGNHLLWRVVNDEIIGQASGLRRAEVLRSEMLADDFRLSCAVLLVGDQGSAGIQFRGAALPDGEVKGYQAGVGPGRWGRLEETHGRGPLGSPAAEVVIRPGEWNTYEIIAVGAQVRTSLNGRPCARLDDPSGPRRGVIALRLGAGGPIEVHFKDIRLEPNPKLERARLKP